MELRTGFVRQLLEKLLTSTIIFINTRCHCIEIRVECIEVLGIQFILNNAQAFAEPLEVYDFSRT